MTKYYMTASLVTLHTCEILSHTTVNSGAVFWYLISPLLLKPEFLGPVASTVFAWISSTHQNEKEDNHLILQNKVCMLPIWLNRPLDCISTCS